MSLRSSVLAGAAALLLLLVLGNPVATDWVLDDAPSWAALTSVSVVASLSLGFGDPPFDQVGPSLLRAVIIVGVAFVLGGLAGRSRPLAAFVGGWGAAFGAMALGGAAFELTADEAYRTSVSSDVVDQISSGAASSGVTAFWLGWVVALAVLIGRDRKVVRVRPTPAPGGLGAAPPAAPYGSAPYGAPAPYGTPAPTPASPAPAPTPVTPAPAPAPATPPPAPTPPASPPPGGGPVIGPPPARPAGMPPDDPTVIG